MMGAGLGRATDALYSGIGGGIDTALDTLIGDGLIGGVFGNDIAADKFKNFLTGDSLGAIADIGTDVALLGLTGGTALPFVAAKALVRNSQPIYDAINGVDSVTGRQLDAGQRAAKGGLAGLDLVLSSLPAGGVFKGAAKGMRNATKAAEEGAKADALKAIENAAKSENRLNAVNDLTEEQLANTSKYLSEHGIDIAEPDSVKKIASKRISKEFDDLTTADIEKYNQAHPLNEIDASKYTDQAIADAKGDAIAKAMEEQNVPELGVYGLTMPTREFEVGATGLSGKPMRGALKGFYGSDPNTKLKPSQVSKTVGKYLESLDQNDDLIQRIWADAQNAVKPSERPSSIEDALKLFGKNVEFKTTNGKGNEVSRFLDNVYYDEIADRFAREKAAIDSARSQALAAGDAVENALKTEKSSAEAIRAAQEAAREQYAESVAAINRNKLAAALESPKIIPADFEGVRASKRNNIASALEDLSQNEEAMKGLSKDIRRAETAQKYNSMEENSVGNLIRNLRDNDWRANRQTVARADLPFVGNKYVPTPEEQDAIVALNEFKEMKAAELAEAGAKRRDIKAAEKEIEKEIKQIENGSYARAAEKESAKGASGLPDANELNRQMEALRDFVMEKNLDLSKPAALKKALKDEGAPKVDDVIKMLFPEKESVGIARRAANTGAALASPGLAAYAQGDYDGLDSFTDYYANAFTHPGDLALMLARPGMRKFNNRFGLQTARNSLPTEALLSANLGMRSGAMGGGTMSTSSPYNTDATPEDQYQAMIEYLTTNNRPTVGLPY
jgi:hypothetical protein